jgi:hypothetical protein
LLRGGWAFHDAATGARLGFFDRNTVGQPCPGPYPTPAVVLRGQLLSRPENGPSHVLATNVSSAERCVASEDGRQVAYQDTSEVVHLLAVDDGRELASRPGFDLRHMLFSRHGLVLIKEKRLEVFGGPDGDFIIELPEGASSEACVRDDSAGRRCPGTGISWRWLVAARTGQTWSISAPGASRDIPHAPARATLRLLSMAGVFSSRGFRTGRA